ncbi:MAG TPA: hypothetical protein VIS51_04345 [Solirubrobacterales bacterium]
MPERAPVIVFDEDKHRYEIDGEFVPSVTQIIKVSDPFDAGPWWGMRVGLAAVVRMLQNDALSPFFFSDEDPDEIILGRQSKTEKAIVEAKLSTNHVRTERADEGLAIHHAIEQIKETGSIPLLSDFEPEMRGFIQAFSKWFVEQDPLFEWQELIVASRRFRYAGRPDAGIASKHGDEAALDIIDFKTSRHGKGPQIYDSWHLQGRGYVTGYNELLPFLPNDALPADRSWSVCLHESGEYLAKVHVCPEELWLTTVQRWWDHEEFLTALAVQAGKKRRKR